MALVTVPIASFADDLVVISIRYNDQTLVIGRIEGVNDSDQPVLVRASKHGYPLQERLIAAHSSERQNVGAHFQFEWVEDVGNDADGNPLGYNLTLGDIRLGARWPA